MDYFLTTEGLQDMMALFAILVGLVLFAGSFIAYCRKIDREDADLDEAPLSPRMYSTIEDGQQVMHDRYFEDPEWKRQAIRQGYKLNRGPIENAAEVLNGMQSLRTELKDHRNPTHPASATWSGDWEEMR